ncbi:MAG: Holliday junction branch migration protein RuvA [Prevotellaceae bacterium]|jgi:Holliday junction DNA helicase RuvA|nr:Holliday junction branch migration protein RuvA [Prevotellaceae bacterium]
MIDYIQGTVSELNPTYAVVENNGVGYFINISLPVFSALSNVENTKLFVYEAFREDAHTLYGFLSKKERELFLLLISVSGIGANTARMVLSSYSVEELQEIIVASNVAALNAIKGIGTKTAQRIIIDLKDKISKGLGADDDFISKSMNNTNLSLKHEAVAALAMLGFSPAVSQKAVDKILKEQPALTVEGLIKAALKLI